MKQKMVTHTWTLKSPIAFSGKVRLAFLTDLHNPDMETEDKIIGKLKGFSPDLVLVGGDVLVGKVGISPVPAVRFMKRLSRSWPVCYAYGNHESRLMAYPERFGSVGADYMAALKNTGIYWLRNDSQRFVIRGLPIRVYGLEPDERYYQKGRKKQGMEGTLREQFEAVDRESYTILLAHTPRYGEEYLRWGADLTLCGHYHGGVMALGSHRGVITPDFRLFSRDCRGLRSKGQSYLLVSAGLGEHTIPIRIHNPRELVLVQVKGEQ